MTNQGSIHGRGNKTWSYTSTLPCTFLALCLIQDRDNFTCLTLLDIYQILGKLWTCIPRQRLLPAFLYFHKSYGSQRTHKFSFHLGPQEKYCLGCTIFHETAFCAYHVASYPQIGQWNCKTGTALDLCPYGTNRVGIIQIVQELLEAWIQIILRR